MTNKPKISVLMAVYNAETYLPEAIDSILKQTFSDFEFIIIDDGSTDRTTEILQQYSNKDSRIRCFQNAENHGLATSLNRGIEIARGNYIARMDGDDISLPNRLEQQIAFMENNSQVGICGTWTKIFGIKKQYSKPPLHSDEIKSHLFFASPFAHPTVMMRKQVLNEYNLRYDALNQTAQDYALWAKAARYTSLANLPQVLLHYRTHSVQSSIEKKQLQLEQTNQTRIQQLQSVGIDFSDEQLELHLKVVQVAPEPTEEFLLAADTWLQAIIAANQETLAFPEPAFSQRLALQWFYLCRVQAGKSLSVWPIYNSSPLSAIAPIGPLASIKFRLLDAIPSYR